MKCKICKKEYEFCKNHHIQSKCYGGEDKQYNRTYLCDRCHELVHYSLIIIEGNFGSLKGTVLIGRKFNEKNITGMRDPKVGLKPNYQKIRNKYKYKENRLKGEKRAGN